MLNCFFASARVGDLLSYTARVSDVTLTWSNVHFIQPGEKIVIFLAASKSSARNEGHSLLLIRNPEARFCRVTHLTRVRSFYPGPVFHYCSGKMLTPAAVNKLLAQMRKLAGVPPNSQYSCHSLRADITTLMTLNSDNFSQTELLAAGHWQSSAVHMVHSL